MSAQHHPGSNRRAPQEPFVRRSWPISHRTVTGWRAQGRVCPSGILERRRAAFNRASQLYLDVCVGQRCWASDGAGCTVHSHTCLRNTLYNSSARYRITICKPCPRTCLPTGLPPAFHRRLSGHGATSACCVSMCMWQPTHRGSLRPGHTLDCGCPSSLGGFPSPCPEGTSEAFYPPSDTGGDQRYCVCDADGASSQYPYCVVRALSPPPRSGTGGWASPCAPSQPVSVPACTGRRVWRRCH